jgi:hypothetical protein
LGARSQGPLYLHNPETKPGFVAHHLGDEGIIRHCTAGSPERALAAYRAQLGSNITLTGPVRPTDLRV